MRRCLICDDHPMLRRALSFGVRAQWPDVEVMEAIDFDEARAAATTVLDLIIVDLTMPGAGPVEGVRLLRAAQPATPLLVLTGIDDDDVLADIAACGVSGILAKTADPDVVMATIALILAGGTALPPHIVERGARTRTEAATISPRQRQVLALLAEGQSNKEIARTLGIGPATVKTHVMQLFGILGTANRTEAAIRARTARLI
jgi:DNA-binding NarL/FixJ family response regulator